MPKRNVTVLGIAESVIVANCWGKDRGRLLRFIPRSVRHTVVASGAIHSIVKQLDEQRFRKEHDLKALARDNWDFVKIMNADPDALPPSQAGLAKGIRFLFNVATMVVHWS